MQIFPQGEKVDKRRLSPGGAVCSAIAIIMVINVVLFAIRATTTFHLSLLSPGACGGPDR